MLLIFLLLASLLVLAADAAHGQVTARWQPQTTNWSQKANLSVGDWGYNRPGYPEGLYIHGITRRAGERVTNPVIYDNDVYDDVFDDELAMVMASQGELNLVGLIVTPVLTDGWGFSKPEWVQTAHESRRNAERSGLRMERIPSITVGTQAESEKAGENAPSAGARLYVQLINERFARDPRNPLIINMGGQSATLASAYALDPSIAEKCIVYYTDIRVYNGHYQWASKLIAAHFRVVSWGDDNWWITKPAQNQWRVLPRPESSEGKDNNSTSGEWRQLTEMRVPLLDHMVKQFQTRGEYCQGPRKGDGYLDGTFLHAWLPGIFDRVALREVRGGQVLHVTSFTPANEERVKAFANERLLNPRAYQARSALADRRPRVVVLSDFPPLDVVPGGAGYGSPTKRSDPDDVQSMIRFLLYGNDFEIEGLVASAATMANVADKQGILDVLSLYDRVDENLRSHDLRYPTADRLRLVTWEGRSGTYGRPSHEIVGHGMDSEASDAIISLVDRLDERPVWFCVWGGSRDLAQAIWKVKHTRSSTDLERFLGKLRIYLIALQDGSARWLLESFPNLFVIVSEKNFQGMFSGATGADSKLSDLAWVNENVRKGHGVLGAMYPECGWAPATTGVIEGDSPSFLHLASAVRGLNDPEKPDQPGWGGRFVQPDGSKNHWFDDPAGLKTVWQWRADVQEDFARRADWMKDPPRRSSKPDERYRVVIMTDMTHDDGNSLIRYLYYSPHFDTEAIIVTPQLPDFRHDSDVPWQKAQSILNAYRSEREQLAKHDSRFPTYESLARVTHKGRGALPIIWLTEAGHFSGDIAGRQVTNSWGKIHFDDWTGEGLNPNGEPKDSEGSEWLQQVFAQKDDRPIYVQLWGGPITLVQALHRFQQRHTPAEMSALLNKLHIYSIHLQDVTTDYFIGLDDVRRTKCAHLGETRSSFGGNRARPRTFAFDMGHFWKYIRAMNPAKVRGHGPLSELYDGGGEGDTPAFLHLVSGVLGLNDPQDPTHGGWGNMFHPMGESFPKGCYHTCPGSSQELERWISDATSSFLARLQWSQQAPGKVNRPPIAVLNGDAGNRVIHMKAKAGDQITLDASLCSDPDGDLVRVRWFHYPTPTSYTGGVEIAKPEDAKQVLFIPQDLGDKTMHMILEVRDDGSPGLVSYRRVIISRAD